MDLKAVYHVLHSLTLFIYATFVWICTYVTESKNIIYRFRDGALNSTDAPFLMLDKPIQNLDHLAFVIYEDNPNPVSSSSYRCLLIVSNLQLSKLVSSYLRKYHGAICLECNTDKNLPRQRVYSKDRSSNVHFLDLNSGHNLLSSAAKCIATSDDSITSTEIEKILQNISPMSPVSLTLIFGPPSLVGLLPWQSRDTEILKWPSHRNLSSSDFIDILHTYCGITKRWGR